MANIRDQNAWVHADQFMAATEKAKQLIRMAAASVVESHPLVDHLLLEAGPWRAWICAQASKEDHHYVYLPRPAFLRIRLLDAEGAPVPNEPYEVVRGGSTRFSGTTDGEGALAHDGLPLTDHILRVRGVELWIPAVSDADKPAWAYLPELQTEGAST